MSETPVVSVEREGDIAWVTIDNPPVNATSTHMRAGLETAIAKVQGAKAAVLLCAGRTFIAGGDMTEFDAPPQLPHLPDVIQQMEDSATPFIALMHGNVLGGGLEVAMGCTWRIAAPGTKFGLPEVNVGLIPGAAGTQRAPRLVGMEAAIDLACAGKILPAEEMLDLGGIDAVAKGDLKQAARDFIANLPARPVALSQRNVPAFSADLIDSKRIELAKRAKGQQSPLENLNALQWALDPFSEGQPKERARHLELRHSPESRALRHAFFAERTVAKPDAIRVAAPVEVGRCAVVGGGLMGAGIATSMLTAGYPVTLIERDSQAAAAAHGRVNGLLDGAVKRGKMSAEKFETTMAAFEAVSDYAEAAKADLAIEAVFEDIQVKKDVFRQLAANMRADAILATNTSYLDPMAIFEGIENQDRCVGLHFFSPAHVMKLLEIVKTPHTSAETLATGFAMGKRMRKIAVLSGICDGFIGNRILTAYRRAADYMLADGAMPHQIDAAMRKFGMSMGPYEIQDLTGLQIAWANRKRQTATRDPSERYVTIADQLCEMGRLGQRSGKGWYAYEDGSRKPIRDEAVENLILDYSRQKGITRRDFTDEEIAGRLMAVLANEGALIVEEGIAERDSDVDMVKVHGYGFPRWRGGPMNYANEIGWEKTKGFMDKVASDSPGSWKIANR